MRIKLLSAGIIGFGILVGSFIVGIALAQTINDAGVRYPVAELGNCQNKDACKTYCNDPAHLEACITYAQKNNLMSESDIAVAKKFLNANGKGPGGCTDQASCQAYCDNTDHINECVAFAEKTGILPPQQLEEAKQVQAAIAKGVKPPPCRSKKECDAYCENPSNMKVCVAFGEAAGFLKGKELEDVKKIMTAIDKGVTPPPCRGKEACDTYCSQPDHMEVCMTFAQAAGLMSPQEMQDTQKVLAAVKKGIKPPPCKGKEECDTYCAEPAHVDECTNFAVSAGFMSEKDAEISKKTGGKGPGGCRGKDQCDSFCNNPDNQQTCFNFAKENGLISQDDLQKMEEGQKQFRQSLENLPSEVASCLNTAVGSDMLEKFKSGKVMPPKDIGDKMGQCFSKMGPPPGQGQGPGMGPGQGPGMGPGSGGMGMPPLSSMPQEVQDCVKSAIGSEGFQQLQSGAGAVKNDNKAELFSKAKNCFEKFGPPQQQQQQMNPSGGPKDFRSNVPGGPPGGTVPSGGPGGCKTAEECKAFCEKNPEVCKNFQPPAIQQGQMQPIMPPQNQGVQPGQNPGGMQPREGMPFNGAMPPTGGMQPPSGTQPMMQPGAMQPPQGMQPPPGTMPPSGSVPPSGSMPPAGMTPSSGSVPPSGGVPPAGSVPPPGSGAPPPGGMQPPPGGAPPPGGIPPTGSAPPAGSAPPPPPHQSYNPPSLGQFVGMIIDVFSR